MQKRVKSFDGTRINYDKFKSDSDLFLVLLHGAGGDLTAWDKERKFFHKKGISTIAIDLRGHGLSDRPKAVKAYGLENSAKDIYDILKTEKIKNYVIAGHCLGGMVAIAFEKLFPGNAKAYVLIDTACKAPKILGNISESSFLAHLLNKILENKDLKDKHFKHVNFNQFIGTGDLNLKRIYSDISHTSLKSWLFTYENIAKFDGIEVLKNMSTQALILEGEKDSFFDVLDAKKIKNLVRKSSLSIIPDANHILVINNPEAVEQEICKFLDNKGFSISKQKL